jgi:hypothetical protein
MDPSTYISLRRAGALLVPVSEGHFYRIWREDEELSRIRCRQWLRFAICDICAKLRSKIHFSHNLGESVRERDTSTRRRLFTQHIQDVKAERGAYYRRRRHAAAYPKESLSIIIDGADQQNMGVPWYVTKTNMMKNCWKIGFNVYGVLVHGHFPYVYFIQDHVKLGKTLYI